MKMIKPIVNISKIIDNYDVVLLGMEGVIAEGGKLLPDARDALISLKKVGKRIVLLTNSPQRVATIADWMRNNNIPPLLFDNIVSAGEILHYLLKSRQGDFMTIGTTYYNMGNSNDVGIFSALDYRQVEQLPKADFMFMGSVIQGTDSLDKYLPVLEYAVNLNIPLICAGNDTSSYMDGEICVAPGAVAEQYAALGGRIITIGKPDPKIMAYAIEGIEGLKAERVLAIGDNITTDIKGANLLGVHSALISKGVHINYLGEGYIPDVAKTREIANNYDAYPEYVISALRW